MNQLEDLVRDTFGERGAEIAGVRFADADVRRRARGMRLRQRAATAGVLALLTVLAGAAVAVPRSLRLDRSVPAGFTHADPAYPDWPARGNRTHDRKLLDAAVVSLDDSGEGPHTKLRLLLAERTRVGGQPVDVVVLAARDALGRPRLMRGFREKGAGSSFSGSFGPAPNPAELTHLWITSWGGGVLLVSPAATSVQVGSATYQAGSGVLPIAAEGSAPIIVTAGDVTLGRGVLEPDLASDDPIDNDVIDWPSRGEPAPRAVVRAAVAATLERESVLPAPERQLASGRLPDGRIFYAFTAGATGTDPGRAGWFWVGASDGTAGELTDIASISRYTRPNLLAWDLDGYVVFLAQPGIRSAEYSTDAGATYQPAAQVDGLGILDVRTVGATDAGEVRVRVVDYPGCATYTWTRSQGGLRGEYCDRYARVYLRQ